VYDMDLSKVTPDQLYTTVIVLLAIFAAIITVDKVIDIIKKWRAPTTDTEKKLAKDKDAPKLAAAFEAELRRLARENGPGDIRVAAYVAQQKYDDWALDYDHYAYLWIPGYGEKFKPQMPCDMWQYTPHGKLPGINAEVDLDVGPALPPENGREDLRHVVRLEERLDREVRLCKPIDISGHAFNIAVLARTGGHDVVLKRLGRSLVRCGGQRLPDPSRGGVVHQVWGERTLRDNRPVHRSGIREVDDLAVADRLEVVVKHAVGIERRDGIRQRREDRACRDRHKEIGYFTPSP
jgi:hypothetical protein